MPLFWQELETHKDKPFFLFTHQPYPEFQIWPQLKARLNEFNIAAWFSAHKHRWGIREDSGHGFTHINIHSVGAVREDYLSIFLRLEQMEDKVEATIRFRNHQTQEWIKVNGNEIFAFSVEL